MAYPYNYQPNYQNYFPVGYQPMYQQGYQQPTPQAQPQMQQQSYAPTQNQVQNGGFVPVRSEAEARSYPVAPGTSITFKNETAPYCYTKTMGFSQLEAPRFEKYRLVKEDEPENSEASGEVKQEYVSKADFGVVVDSVKGLNEVVALMKSDVDGLKSDVYGLSGRKRIVKKQVEVDDGAE